MKLPKFGLNTLFAKIIVLTLVSLLLTVFILLYYQGYQQNQIGEELSKNKLLSDGQHQAEALMNALGPANEAAATLADVLAASVNDTVPQITRPQVNNLLKNMLIDNKIISGIGSAWEPNAFDNQDNKYKNAPGHDITGIFIPYWYISAKDSLVHRPYSNYYVEDFYMKPKQNLKPYFAGPQAHPYDEAKTQIITFSYPIVKKGQFLGVAFVQVNAQYVQNMMSSLDAEYPNQKIHIYSWDGLILYATGRPDLTGKKGNVFLSDFQTELNKIRNAPLRIYEEDNAVEAQVPIQFNDASSRWQLRNQSSYQAMYITEMRQTGVVSLLILLLIVVAVGEFLLLRRLLKPLQLFTKNSTYIATGNTNIEKDFTTTTKEFKTLRDAFNTVVQYLSDLSSFADELGQENFEVDYKPKSNKDILGQSLLKLKNSLKLAREQEADRQKEEEQRNWINEGLARFNEILHRRYEEQSEMAYVIIQEIIDYVDAIQGGLFIYKSEDEEQEQDEQNGYLELMASVAYDERKYLKKQLDLGEELAGACALEKKTIYMTDIPDDYVHITSGLGEASPKNLILVPLTIKQRVYGVIELAAFNPIESYKREFLEKLAESLATALHSSQINERTARLLEKSKQQAEEMASQEEEMRQNLEELQATQEDLNKKQKDLHALEQIIDIAFQRLVLDENAVIREANDNMLKNLGFEQDELIGQNHRKILDKTKLNEFAAMWKSIVQGNDYHGQSRWIKSDGGHSWHLTTYMPVMKDNEGVEKVFCISYDITRSKELEDRLHEIDGQLRDEQDKSAANQEELNRIKEEYDTEIDKQKRINKALRDELENYKDKNQ